MKNLVIVESPTKARTIGRYLGGEYTIKASMGHVMDLPKSTLGVDVEHDFEPQYEVVSNKKKVISELRTAVKSADSIILATDPDREGEAIASHVKDVLGSELKFRRIVFHEITKEAIEEALAHPRSIDEHLVDSQTARRVLDRLVGYKLSPLLWQKVRRGLSAGRVQSVALRLIVEREREIEKFKKEEYWTIIIKLNKETKETNETDGAEFELIEIQGRKIEQSEKVSLYDGDYTFSKTTVTSKEQAEKIVSDIKPKRFVVQDVQSKEMRRSPQPPYTTSTLQQDAARRLGFAGRRTMSIAQKLYEEGFITYHRTDSVSMAISAVSYMRSYVESQFGKKYIPESPRFYAVKQKLAQEAHEAIRPTKVDKLQSQIGRDYEKLYELIWKRAVASQMSDALIESTVVLVDTHDTKYRFKANGSVLVFDGFLRVNPQALQDNKLPEFTKGEALSFVDARADEHETQHPPRYNDASLIKSLEEGGIGRPSTYASIVGTIESRGYIERQENRFIPSSVGVAVNDFLVQHFGDIDDIPFTAQMEDDLDNIAQGKRDWVPMIQEFYAPFEKKLETVKEKSQRVTIEVEKTDEKCPQCQSPLVVRTGRFGKFLACSTFPACKFTKQFVEATGLKCPKDGGDVVVKKTRKGRKFFGCSNYPKCDFASWKLEDIKKS